MVLPGAIRLLIVDDDVVLCNQLAGNLATAGFQVVTAHEAAAAYAQIAVTPPDVAIVDLEMPGVDGTVVIRELKRLQSSALHVIVLTGHDEEERRAAAFEAGADDYVVKPISTAEIRRRIMTAIRKQRDFVQVRLDKEVAERRLVYGHEASALLAHDLNNGLTISLSNLAYLTSEVKGDSDVMDALAATLRSVRRMAGLVANFVDIARFEDAAVKPITALGLVRELLQSVIEVHAPSVTHGIRFNVDCADDLKGRYDQGLVERVLHNLFGNAARYCNPGGTITLGARPWREAGDGSLEIWVANTGPEIPQDLRERLFEKYARGKGGKRGMGLYFCRLVAEAHGGSITCNSTAAGPSFLLRIPGRV